MKEKKEQERERERSEKKSKRSDQQKRDFQIRVILGITGTYGMITGITVTYWNNHSATDTCGMNTVRLTPVE